MKICSVKGCGKKYYGNGLCNKHYHQEYFKRYTHATLEENNKQKNKICSVDTCDRGMYAQGLCRLHYARKCRGVAIVVERCQYPGCNKYVHHALHHFLCAEHFKKVLSKLFRDKYKVKIKNSCGKPRYASYNQTTKEICGRCLKPHPVLEVHHKDFNPLNSNPFNLQTLCKPCHIQVHRRHMRTRRLDIIKTLLDAEKYEDLSISL